ncbi:MAG TPA: J domain-containing protein [Allosphingosinicella sp.]|jgi:curved DNA-binding protein CbpA
MASVRSLYDVLNVSPEAEPEVLEAAYKVLIKKYHPDHLEQAGRRDAAEINRAFSTLRDPERRAQYDHHLWSKQQAQRLAELRALDPPRRGSRLFGWSGWLVAGALGCAVAAMAVEREIAPLSAGVRAAEEDPRRVPPEVAAARKASAALDNLPDHPSADAVIARVRAEARGVQLDLQPRHMAALKAVPEATALPRTAPRPRKVRKSAPAASQAKREKADFLEREGYIY